MNIENLNKPQIIVQKGKPAFAVLPYSDYEALINALEEAQDVHDYELSLEEQTDSTPVEVIDRLLAGENGLRVWREYRGITQNKLAKDAGISIPYLCEIETNKKTPSLKTASKLAKALELDMDDLNLVD